MSVLLRERLDKRFGALDRDRQPFISDYKSLSQFVAPHRGRFQIEAKKNTGIADRSSIINNEAGFALRILSSGMMAGATSPSRPWFKLKPTNGNLMEIESVRWYLSDVENMMREMFNSTNLYKTLQNVYAELGTFGTAPMAVMFDPENVMHCISFTAGTYYLAQNTKGRINAFYREFRMTVEQVVTTFGLDNCTERTRNMWARKEFDQEIIVRHVLEPNNSPDEMPSFQKGKAYICAYYERGTNEKKFLELKGFDYFPIVCVRWETVGEDVYSSNCPAIEALGDTKQLQLMEKEKTFGVQTYTKPPMRASAENKDITARLYPGGVSMANYTGEKSGFEPLYQQNMNLQHVRADIEVIEGRIGRFFYADLFLMLSQMDRTQMTATEVAERHEEKLLMLGPVLESIHSELLNPLIDLAYRYLEQAGKLPEPPQVLEGEQLKVEYVSILAQAQQAIGVGTIERVAGYVGNLVKSTGDTSFLDKFDGDQSIDEYARMVGAPAKIIRSDEAVEAMRAKRNQTQEAAQVAEMAQSAAGTAKTLAETPTGDNSTLLQQLGLY